MIDEYRAVDEEIPNFELKKLFDREANWLAVPLEVSLKYCTNCKTCDKACHIYLSSKKEIYKPTYRAKILKKLKKQNKNSNLIELAYRCNLCMRCKLFCPLSLENGLIAREIRKFFSQEFGIAPKALHEGTVKQLNTGYHTGLSVDGFKNIVKFMEEDIAERFGIEVKIPVDKKRAEILLINNAGDFFSRIECIESFVVIFEKAGLDWTLSSKGDAVNYGLWYDDFQYLRIVERHLEIARELDVEKIVVGECGHAHKALIPVESEIKRESYLPLLWKLVKELELDPEKNNFPVTLHDPCNIVRKLGIVEPQRKILKKVCSKFIEMNPNGIYNYCCGGGGGLAVIDSMRDFRIKVSTKMKFEQIMNALKNFPKKYVCAPCSNCKRVISEISEEIVCVGVVDLVANALIFD
ncbi:MAG: (Fe-S)-binding protein [Archaeoglobaceae archaeon]|nr:(Fe-S)-binding protein [Archaeoglobaceae archaeon]MCX8151623.1 (Fe-S)-binding protein [Archaeoglobaceae archaeon]MDW8013099.1 (Fe-S)-binding protein [Archaeoglobaceae archaeon]